MQHIPIGTCHVCLVQYPIDDIEVCTGCGYLVCDKCRVDGTCESCDTLGEIALMWASLGHDQSQDDRSWPSKA